MNAKFLNEKNKFEELGYVLIEKEKEFSRKYSELEDNYKKAEKTEERKKLTTDSQFLKIDFD